MLWRQGHAAEEIAGIYEHLDLAGIYAALAYYFANREAVDATIDAEAELLREIAEQRGANAD